MAEIQIPKDDLLGTMQY